MYLTSYEFVLFVMICFILYYLLPKKCQWVILLVASYVFYFLSGAFYPLVLFTTSIVTYCTGMMVYRKSQTDSKWLKENKDSITREEKKKFKADSAKIQKRYMLAGVLLCLLILGVFKYTNFVIENINSILGLVGKTNELDAFDILLPMGLSFYTFQSISYVVDIYRGKIEPQKNLLKYMLFVSFFPQLIQGPISRYSQVEESLYKEHEFNTNIISHGLKRIIWGFFKKLVVADTIATAVICISEDVEYYTGAWVLVGIIFYAIQLYADFSGGIDITIGVAGLFGVCLPENFNKPYFSKNIAEFCRRWHITMGTWFKDYVFYPISISPSMNKVTKKCKNLFGRGVAKRVPVYVATIVTWFATGLWHGASWNFVIWGLMNGIVLLVSQELEPLYRKFHDAFPKLTGSKIYGGFEILRTFLLMGCINMLDYCQDVVVYFKQLISMFLNFDLSALTGSEFIDLGLSGYQYGVILVGVAVMFIASLLDNMKIKFNKCPYVVSYALYLALFVAVILFGAYGYGFDANQFIYNQF